MRIFTGRVMELVYMYGLGPYAARLVGSNPTSPTNNNLNTLCMFKLLLRGASQLLGLLWDLNAGTMLKIAIGDFQP